MEFQYLQKRIPVVTAFVYSGEKVALVKRSENVGTYQGSWAGFSGYVERLPLNQAYQELAEEAGLAENQVHLFGIGIPLPVDDEVGRSWLVFPFLFKLDESAEIVLDWEGAEWRWFLPEQVSSIPTVPGLSIALSRVWPPFGDGQFWGRLAVVAADMERGASELARVGLEALKGFAEKRPSVSEFTRVVCAYAACRPIMGVFPGLACRLLLRMKQEGEPHFGGLVSEIMNTVEHDVAASAQVAAEVLDSSKRIFTLSFSNAVAQAIEAWYQEGAEVVVAESLPGGEGRALRQWLSNRGIPARLIPDVEVEQTVKVVDAVVVGCDSITEDGGLINKIRTRTAVLAAEHADVPAYAVAQTFKVLPPGWPFSIEVHRISDTDTAVEAFDVTPIDAMKAVFTEEGTLTSERLRAIHAELNSVGLLEVGS